MSTFITKHARELGLKKLDARTPMILEVLRSDITKARQRDPQRCVFANACRRTDPTAKAVYFFKSTAWVEHEKSIVRYLLPPSVEKEIVSFDRSGITAPGFYQLSPPSKSERLTEVKKRDRKRKGRHLPGAGKIQRKFRHHTTMVRTAVIKP